MLTKYVTNTYQITNAYKKILINAGDAKVKIEPSNDDNTNLIFFEKKKRPYEFSIQDDTLTIKSAKRKWYHFLRIGIDHSEIKLCVPKSILEAISIKSNTGRVDISSIICNGAIYIEINTGNVKLEGVCCKAFDSKGNTGSVSLSEFIAEESISIKRNTGKVLFNDCSAREIHVKTNTGSVCGKLPSDTVFVCVSNTGKIETPKPAIGEEIGRVCEIKTNTGNIKFE